MGKYVLINFTTQSDSLIEDLLDNDILKEYAFSTKYKTPNLSYENILVPVCPYNKMDENFEMEKMNYKKSISADGPVSDNTLYSLWKLFKDSVEKMKYFAIDIVKNIDNDSVFSVSYTDGSFSSKTKIAGYACCKLLNESADGLFDEFTERNYNYDIYSGSIKDGTNNVGELTGIQVAVKTFDDKTYQLIISDSIYGIKSFREYIHVWKNNGYRAYNKKEIKNKELIINTYEEMKKNSNKIILFKWTKGHASSSFNNKCDEIAKKEANI